MPRDEGVSVHIFEAHDESDSRASQKSLEIECVCVRGAIYSCSGPSLPGTNMHMLFPFKSVCASFVDLRPFGVISYSVTSSRTILTKSSNPRRVPVNSRSFFITTHMREPIHLSMSSRGKIWEAIQVQVLLRVGPDSASVVRSGNQNYIVCFLPAIAIDVYPTQHEISKMPEMSSNHENGKKRCATAVDGKEGTEL